MLFFGPSFSHLVCYFNYFFAIQVYFSKLKRYILISSKLARENWGEMAVLVILM